MCLTTSCSPVVFTGPMTVYPQWPHTDRVLRHLAAIEGAGHVRGKGVRYAWPTASVTWDGAMGRIYVAVEDDADPHDWREVLGVLRMAGWLIGRDGYTDIGEPGWDRANRVWLWVLPCP